jgi:putative ABC transport system ATP-binding protein
VAIGRAVVGNPLLILADEPTGNLDSANGEDVMNLLKQLNSDGTSIVMVTHSPKDAAYAKRIIRLFDGHLVNENESSRMHPNSYTPTRLSCYLTANPYFL